MLVYIVSSWNPERVCYVIHSVFDSEAKAHQRKEEIKAKGIDAIVTASPLE